MGEDRRGVLEVPAQNVDDRADVLDAGRCAVETFELVPALSPLDQHGDHAGRRVRVDVERGDSLPEHRVEAELVSLELALLAPRWVPERSTLAGETGLFERSAERDPGEGEGRLVARAVAFTLGRKLPEAVETLALGAHHRRAFWRGLLGLGAEAEVDGELDGVPLVVEQDRADVGLPAAQNEALECLVVDDRPRRLRFRGGFAECGGTLAESEAPKRSVLSPRAIRWRVGEGRQEKCGENGECTN